MATKTKKNTDMIRLGALTEELSERGRDVWLAGLGALVMAEEESTKLYNTVLERGKKLGDESVTLFDDLVKRGRKIEQEGLKRIDDTVGEVSDTQKKYTQQLENIFENVLERFGVPTRAEVKELSGKVNALSAKVDALVKVLDKNGEAVTAERTTYHVVPREDGWAITKEGAARATSLHDTKNEAVDAARDLAREQVPSMLVIHKKDGTIQDTSTYDA
jgi:poly(hydroxyalkanoate) granule-associated protein